MTAIRQFHATGNALSPELMTPAERRAELCRILALGVIRLRIGPDTQRTTKTGEIPLHNSADQSGHATPVKRSTA